MKKLFVFPHKDNLYVDELNCAWSRINNDAGQIDLSDLNIEYLKKNSIEVIISTGLPQEWYYIFKGLNIVSITLGEYDEYYDLADIIIDCKHSDPKRYFINSEHSICGNPDFNFEEITNLIHKLNWDSEFFGFNIAFLSCMHLTENIFLKIEKYIRKKNIRLIEYLCNCHDARSVRVAEDKGFRFTDIRLQYIRDLSDIETFELPRDVQFGKAEENHIPELRKIAHGIYEDSRYHYDKNFESERIIEFYKDWVTKSIRAEFDHECWCLFGNDQPMCFCTIRYEKSETAIIGLVGVGAQHQGTGLAKKMIQMVFNVLQTKGINAVTVVTQGRNYQAQNLYQKLGFRTKFTQLWYHKWMY